MVHQLILRAKFKEEPAVLGDRLMVVRALVVKVVLGDDQLHTHTAALPLQEQVEEGHIREPSDRHVDGAAR